MLLEAILCRPENIHIRERAASDKYNLTWRSPLAKTKLEVLRPAVVNLLEPPQHLQDEGRRGPGGGEGQQGRWVRLRTTQTACRPGPGCEYVCQAPKGSHGTWS